MQGNDKASPVLGLGDGEKQDLDAVLVGTADFRAFPAEPGQRQVRRLGGIVYLIARQMLSHLARQLRQQTGFNRALGTAVRICLPLVSSALIKEIDLHAFVVHRRAVRTDEAFGFDGAEFLGEQCDFVEAQLGFHALELREHFRGGFDVVFGIFAPHFGALAAAETDFHALKFHGFLGVDVIVRHDRTFFVVLGKAVGGHHEAEAADSGEEE